MTASPARICLALAFVLAPLGCADQARAPEPPPECAAAWADSDAVGVVDLLARATADSTPIWMDYSFADGTYVVNAGASAAGNTCVGIWKAGAVTVYAALPTAPKLITPLYGYHFLWQGNGGTFDPLVQVSAQPEEVKAWLAAQGVESAVVLPVHITGFPMVLPPLLKAQTGLHEAFHVEAQMPTWVGPSANWPSWDRQPERSGARACYQGDRIDSAFARERDALEHVVSALLDRDSASACASAADFQRRRAARYDLLRRVTVMDADSTPVSCRDAESILELEEGTADYASWTALYRIGLVTREQLFRRYAAQQNDRFYLTGAMQLHALSLMDPAGFPALTREIAASASPAEGTPAALFTRGVERFCRRPS